MSISVTPNVPVIAAQGVASDLVLQPGSVIDAQVLKLLADNQVRIAISGLAIDVLTEIPLSAGQALQLAVSQTPDGIRLAVVGQGSGPAAGTSPDAITLAPAALVDAAANPPVSVAPSRNELTPLERVAVAAAAQSPAASAAVAEQPVLQAAATSTLAPEIDLHEILLPQGPLPVADGSLEAGSTGRIVLAATLLDAGPRAATVGAALNLLQETLQESS